MTVLRDAHSDLHSEDGALPGEHPGRAANPVVKVHDLAWLEFEKPDLGRSERFAEAFGFTTALRTSEELHLRGSDPGSPCVLVRRAPRSRFVGPAFRAAEASDVARLAEATGTKVERLPESLGGRGVTLTDPDGMPVRVVTGTHELPELPAPDPLVFNLGHEVRRVNATQRPPRRPAVVQRLGHVVLQSSRNHEMLDWYLEHLGFIVSDFAAMHGDFLRDMSQWVSEGKVKYKEFVTEGLDSAPEAFMGLLKGANFGKQLVRIGPDKA